MLCEPAAKFSSILSRRKGEMKEECKRERHREKDRQTDTYRYRQTDLQREE